MTDLIARILALAGILETEAELKLEDLKAKFPEGSEALDKFLEWVQPQLEVVLDPTTAGGLLAKVASELKTGHPSYDPKHWVIP